MTLNASFCECFIGAIFYSEKLVKFVVDKLLVAA